MANMFMRFPKGKAKVLTLSYDDGLKWDMRLIEIMQKYGLKGTFNLNSGMFAPEEPVDPENNLYGRMSRKQVSELYADSGMEVAIHGLTHPPLDLMPANMCTREILQDRENLEEQFGTIIRGMAYPYGSFNDSVVDCLKSCGIAYARTTISTERFEMPSDWLRLTATCHHNNPKLMNLAKLFVDNKGKGKPIMFYLWGHSSEFEYNNNWYVIEEFAEYIGGRCDIWYATNIEIYDYVDAFSRLLFSTNGKMVYNPTNMDLFFSNDGKPYCVASGETLSMCL